MIVNKYTVLECKNKRVHVIVKQTLPQRKKVLPIYIFVMILPCDNMILTDSECTCIASDFECNY